MSFFAFNIIGNALDTFQTAQNVTSDNISNISTPGASRQEADIVQAVPIDGSPFLPGEGGSPGTQGEGAVVSQIARIHQDSYDGLYRTATSSQYYYTEEQSNLTTLQSNFGEPSNGVNTAYTKLQSAIVQASQGTATTQVTDNDAVLQQAQTFATALNSASTALTQQESSVVSQGTTLVSKANTLINQIAALNGQIRSLTAAGSNPNTYLDQRDTAIDQLSQLLPTSTALQPNGSSLVTVNGLALVNDTEAYDLAPPVVGTASDGTTTLVVGFANDTNPTNPSPIPLGSGELGALTDVYNNKLLPYGQQLDNFASSAASEMNRITQAAVDSSGNVGTALFTPAAGSTSISAGSISVAITDPTELPLGLITTAAGTLTTHMNSANNTVSTATAIDGNTDLYNPPPVAGLTGTLTVAVDGASQTFTYNTSSTTVPPGNSDTIADFMSSFNAGHYGVTASYDPKTQTIIFARDPNNIDAVHRALQGTNATTAGFTITDSGTATVPATQGYPAGSLLQALGANAISGVAQTPLNAFGSADTSAANALTTMFSASTGIGALQTTASAVSSATAGSVTITQPLGAPGAFSTVNVGQELTIVHDAGLAGQTTQTVTVSAVNRNAGTITVNASVPIAVGDALTTTPQTTLGLAYQSLVTQMGLDGQTAKTGVATQSALAESIDSSRQSVDGINIDEETQNLLMYQNAYSAAAKTLETLNTMMQTTLGLITGG